MKPELLEQQDCSRKTPLHSCLMRGADAQVLLDFMLREYPERCKPALNQAGEVSCLHEAITHGMESCADKMLKLVEMQALLSRDFNQNTPLHLSVDPLLWPEWKEPDQALARVSFIEELLGKCRAALEARNMFGQTPYQYYMARVEQLHEADFACEKGPKYDLIFQDSLVGTFKERPTVHSILLDASMHLPLTKIRSVLYGPARGKLAPSARPQWHGSRTKDELCFS